MSKCVVCFAGLFRRKGLAATWPDVVIAGLPVGKKGLGFRVR